MVELHFFIPFYWIAKHNLVSERSAENAALCDGIGSYFRGWYQSLWSHHHQQHRTRVRTFICSCGKQPYNTLCLRFMLLDFILMLLKYCCTSIWSVPFLVNIPSNVEYFRYNLQQLCSWNIIKSITKKSLLNWTAGMQLWLYSGMPYRWMNECTV